MQTKTGIVPESAPGLAVLRHILANI